MCYPTKAQMTMPQQRKQNSRGKVKGNAPNHANTGQDDAGETATSSHTVDCTAQDDRIDDLTCVWRRNLTSPRCWRCNIKSCDDCVDCGCPSYPDPSLEWERPVAKPAPSAGVLPRYWRHPQETHQDTKCNIQNTITKELTSNPALPGSSSMASTPRATPERQRQQDTEHLTTIVDGACFSCVFPTT